jgi:hypothetical protein
MLGPYPGELRRRVIGFVEAGGSRREAVEQFESGVSSAIRWMQRFRKGRELRTNATRRKHFATGGVCPSVPCGIPGGRSALSRSSLGTALLLKKRARRRAKARRRGARRGGSASKGCLTPLALYLLTKLPSLRTWPVPTVGAHAGNASLAMFRWGTGKR